MNDPSTLRRTPWTQSSWTRSPWTWGVPVLLVVQAGVLLAMGRPPICTCGYVKFWEGDALSSEMSQHLFDWYTFSHIVHGLLFYFALRLIFPKLPIAARLLAATGLEVAWEIAENTPWVIAAYRQQALAQGYIGDSAINSLFDTFSMITGFALARFIPVSASVLAALALEAFAAYAIHDNLTLNVLNFIHQFDAVTKWQSQIH
jgi:Protein of unknown function (DUF2585)